MFERAELDLLMRSSLNSRNFPNALSTLIIREAGIYNSTLRDSLVVVVELLDVTLVGTFSTWFKRKNVQNSW